jgi:hypothetical protein
MSKYADIIKALEEATGPSRELDGMIWAALNPKAKVKEVFPAYGYERKTRIMFTLPPKRTELVTKNVGEFLDAFDWTASLDASIALAERMLPTEGFTVTRYGYPDKDKPRVVFSAEMDEDIKVVKREGTLAIALLIAMFRALEAQEVTP